MHLGFSDPSSQQNFQILKIQDGGRRCNVSRVLPLLLLLLPTAKGRRREYDDGSTGLVVGLTGGTPSSHRYTYISLMRACFTLQPPAASMQLQQLLPVHQRLFHAMTPRSAWGHPSKTSTQRREGNYVKGGQMWTSGRSYLSYSGRPQTVSLY